MDDERREAIRRAWEGMKSWERFFVRTLIIVGTLMALTGGAMILRACQAT